MSFSKRLLVLPILTAALLGLTSFIYLTGDQAAAEDRFSGSQWKLPKHLGEASGLALIQGIELLIHNDEEGLIYKVDLEDMTTNLVASLGRPAAKNDFEGIAIANSDVYLATSSGLLYQAADLSLTEPDQTIAPQIIDTGLEGDCEIEGLTHLNGLLLLPCKTAYLAEHKNKLLIFAYSIIEGSTAVYLDIPIGNLPGVKKLQPTAIDIDAANYYVLSGHRLLVIDRKFKSSRAFALPKKRHIKPEGLAVLTDGSLVIVDDNKKGKSRLTHYEGLHALKEKQ